MSTLTYMPKGQALMARFFRSLNQLTTIHKICTILVNASVGPSNAHQTQQRIQDDNVSLFASVSGKPGLGQAYAHLIDVSIFVSSLPKRREDAEAVYARNARFVPKWKPVSIFEVIKDRKGSRRGQWGAFEATLQGELIPYE